MELVAQLGVVDELAGDQPFDGLAPPFGRAGRRFSASRAYSALTAAISRSPTVACAASSGRRTDLGTSARSASLTRKSPKRTRRRSSGAGRCRADPVAGIEASLGEQRARDRRRRPFAGLEHRQPVLDRGGKGAVQPLQVGGVGDGARVGDRVDPGRDRLLQLRQPLAQPGERPRTSVAEAVWAGRVMIPGIVARLASKGLVSAAAVTAVALASCGSPSEEGEAGVGFWDAGRRGLPPPRGLPQRGQRPPG